MIVVVLAACLKKSSPHLDHQLHVKCVYYVCVMYYMQLIGTDGPDTRASIPTPSGCGFFVHSSKTHLLRLSPKHVSHKQHSCSFSQTLPFIAVLCLISPVQSAFSPPASHCLPHPSSSVSLSVLIWKQQVHLAKFTDPTKGGERERGSCAYTVPE